MLAAVSLLLLSPSVLAYPTTTTNSLTKRTDQTTFDTLAFYFKYASSAAQVVCAKPNGNILVANLNDNATDTQGYIARDDTKKEIIAVFRGSTTPTDYDIDGQTTLVDFQSPGVNPPAGVKAHQGFLTAYNSVASEVISTVKSELAAHPDYRLVTSGHSLGGSLSSLGAVSLKSNFPNSTVIMYTYGQPRTGNGAYATMVDSMFPSGNAFRSVHTIDGAPTIFSTTLGFRHHGTEFWQTQDPGTAENTKECIGDEDPACSASIPFESIGEAHLNYYNIVLHTPFCT